MKKLGVQCAVILAVLFSIPAVAQDVAAPAKSIYMDDSMYEGSKIEEAVNAYNKGVREQGQQEYKKAIKYYKEALELDPNYVFAWDNMGICYRRIGNAKEAIESYQKSIALFPRGTFAHINLGLLYAFQEKFDLAIAEYKKVVEINPSDPEGYYGLTMVYINAKQYENAIVSGKETVRLYEAGNNGLIGDGEMLLGQAYYFNGDTENAKIWFEKAKDHGVKVPDELLK